MLGMLYIAGDRRRTRPHQHPRQQAPQALRGCARSAVEGWRKFAYMNAINRLLSEAPAVDVHIVTQEPD